MNEPAAICVSGLSHLYGKREALHDVSFRVPQGSFFGLLGPNGGGKTTLFRILSTLVKPSAGTASVFGLDVAVDSASVRRQIGVVFQSPALDRKLTVAENLRHQGHLYQLHGRELEGRSREMLERVGLWDRRDSRVEELSGGMRRRAELAKGCLHRPRLLLLDEPSTGLDPNARRDVWNYLHRLRDQEGVTVVMTTHWMDEAEKCDQVGILDGGRLIAFGAPDELKERIGGDVITAEADDPETLARDIQERFELACSRVDGTVRIEQADGHRFVARLIEAFPGRIRAIRIGKPTLDDVFVHHTGHRFEIRNGREES